MKLKKKLFEIFGPVVCAAVILIAILVSPFNFRSFNSKTIREAAVSQSTNIFKGTVVKQKALEEGYVPFMGSSELSRMDPMHPSVLAQKYDRNYRPFLLGAAGSQSLSQFWGMQGINNQLKGKKVVFIISPQWFVKRGINKNAFALYYSNLQAVTWLKTAKNTLMDRYAARRLLDMPSSHSDKMIEQCLLQVAAGQKLNKVEKGYLDLKYNELIHEDQLFSTIGMNDRVAKIDREASKLPRQYNYQKLDSLAYQLGAKDTTNNPFQVDNAFWNKRLKSQVSKLHGEQAKFDYVSSPEFGDFQLVLNQFAKDHTDVLFVIPPINARWAKYTGLKMSMINDFNQKIKYQLQKQGFNNIVDLTNDGREPYFMQDTIHLGWRGWLKMDQAVDPFLSNDQPAPEYHIDNTFYNKSWQMMQGKKLKQYLQTHQAN